ncbi:MAG TPA: hypothetical protein VER17_21395 [Tepidisphaeraceae bacterium]|nr:hypothetical protein [Tepidisphaeraceae bacterium]
MSEARVDNIEAIKAFKRALWKFAETANVALADADADGASTLRWLETEQRTYWTSAVRKSQERVKRCEEAVRHKKIFKDSSGRTPSAVDEEKALAKAKRMLQHAEERLENVRRYAPKVQREILLYKGIAQRLGTFVAADIPVAAGKLDKIVQTLEAYMNLSLPGTATGAMSFPAGEPEAASGAAPPPAETSTDSTPENSSASPAEPAETATDVPPAAEKA